MCIQPKNTGISTQNQRLNPLWSPLNPNNNGAIEVLVGGFKLPKSKFNRATQSSRQPGSSFKPLFMQQH